MTGGLTIIWVLLCLFIDHINVFVTGTFPNRFRLIFFFSVFCFFFWLVLQSWPLNPCQSCQMSLFTCHRWCHSASISCQHSRVCYQRSSCGTFVLAGCWCDEIIVLHNVLLRKRSCQRSASRYTVYEGGTDLSLPPLVCFKLLIYVVPLKICQLRAGHRIRFTSLRATSDFCLLWLFPFSSVALSLSPSHPISQSAAECQDPHSRLFLSLCLPWMLNIGGKAFFSLM